jgi:hypothetical protein
MGTISIYCPKMKITKINGKLHKTAAEPMRVTIMWDDGTTTIIPDVIIPITEVDRIGLLHWRVKRCVGADKDNYVIVSLPEEDVCFRLLKFGMVAVAINALVITNLPGKGQWSGEVEFPNCRTGIFTMTAAAVTANGLLTKQPPPPPTSQGPLIV